MGQAHEIWYHGAMKGPTIILKIEKATISGELVRGDSLNLCTARFAANAPGHLWQIFELTTTGSET